MTAPQKMLPAASEISVSDALDMALEGVSLAIKQMLGQRADSHRFTEIKRLSTIGEAIGRQRARSTNRVEDFAVGDRGFGCPDPEMGDLRALEQDGLPVPPWIGAPRNVAEPNMGGMVGEMLGAMQPMIDQIQAKNERDAERAERRDASEARCAQAQELESLMAARDRAQTEDEQTLVQDRIDALLAAVDEPEAPQEPEDVTVEQIAPAAPELQIRCPACGSVHGRHWITQDGIPRNCDICGGETILEPTPINDAQHPAAERPAS